MNTCFEIGRHYRNQIKEIRKTENIKKVLIGIISFLVGVGVGVGATLYAKTLNDNKETSASVGFHFNKVKNELNSIVSFNDNKIISYGLTYKLTDKQIKLINSLKGLNEEDAVSFIMSKYQPDNITKLDTNISDVVNENDKSL